MDVRQCMGEQHLPLCNKQESSNMTNVDSGSVVVGNGGNFDCNHCEREMVNISSL